MIDFDSQGQAKQEDAVGKKLRFVYSVSILNTLLFILLVFFLVYVGVQNLTLQRENEDLQLKLYLLEGATRD